MSSKVNLLALSLMLKLIVTKIQAEIRGLELNPWYLDDGTLIVSPEDLVAALMIVNKEGSSLGLHFKQQHTSLHPTGV